jgi:hypothetical protein
VDAEQTRRADESFYRRACACGVDEIMDDYRLSLLELEQELLCGQLSTGPASLNARLRPQLTLLPALHSLVSTLRRERLGGSALLSLLAERRDCAGAPALQAALGRLCWHADGAALRQLQAWLLHGVLRDPCAEFFVVRLSEQAEEGAATAAAVEDGGAANWHSSFGLRLAQPLPPWLELGGAEAALFCGRAVRFLEQPRGAFAHLGAGSAQPLLPAATRAEWAAQLAQLAACERLERAAVEHLLLRLLREAGAMLWALLGRRAQLTEHLAALRDFLLLGRGDFFAAFLEEAEADAPPCDQQRLQTAWAAAAQRGGCADCPFFSRVALHFDAPPEQEQEPPAESAADALWRSLRLHYAVPWPLGALLPPSALAAYSALGVHLMRLQRSRRQLASCWLPLRRGAAAGQRTAALALRQRMDGLLAAWEAYVQAAVLQPAHDQLLRASREAQDWGEAARAHAAFLAAAQGGTFLELRPVAEALAGVMRFARRLAQLVQAAQAAPAAEPLQHAQLAQLEQQWRRSAQQLLAALRGGSKASAQNTAARAPSLRMLLERLEDAGQR